MQPIYKTPHIAIYQLDSTNNLVKQYLVSTPETREICNDPQICGINYTRKLQSACIRIFQSYAELDKQSFSEQKATIICRLQSGLPFDMRDVLADSFYWNNMLTTFWGEVDDKDLPDSALQTYAKLQIPNDAQIFWGDAFTQNHCFNRIIEKLIKHSSEQSTTIDHLIVICFGSDQIVEKLEEYASRLHLLNPSFTGIEIFFFEGRFTTSKDDSLISIKSNTHDLLRLDAEMAPEFIHSQYEMPFYPLEQCAIYNSVNRAYDIRRYIEEVISYWETIRKFASQGITFEMLLKERFPKLDASKYGKQNLLSLAEQHITKLKRVLMVPNLPIE